MGGGGGWVGGGGGGGGGGGKVAGIVFVVTYQHAQHSNLPSSACYYITCTISCK